jgi:formylglycine-generating enzyme required for sulfatase activity
MNARSRMVFLIIFIVFSCFVMIQSAQSANFDRDPLNAYAVYTAPHDPIPQKPRQYVLYRATEPITIDGSIDETSWAHAEWTNQFDHILSTRGYTKPWLATRAKMLWDDERIYFAAELEEPNLIARIIPTDSMACWDNDLEIFLDVDDDAQNYIELQFNIIGSVTDVFYHKEFHRGGIVMGWPQLLYGRPYSDPFDLKGLNYAVRPEGSINYPLDTDKKWTLEVSIPWATLNETSLTGQVNRNGKYLRIGFSRVEYQWPRDVWPITNWGGGGANWDWTWTPNFAYDMHVPECWGRVIVSERSVFQPKDVALEQSFPFTEAPRQLRPPKAGEMVMIKGGAYTVGPDATDKNDSPQGTVTVKDFFIDRYEVTLGEYVKFLNAGGHDGDYHPDMGDPDLCGITKNGPGNYSVVPGREFYPVVFMKLESAEAFAAWAGKRLPTEYEWEVAARGKEGRMYPWGNEPPGPERANFNFLFGHPTQVGSFEKGKTPEGVYDMAGNVWEVLQGNWTEYPWAKKLPGIPEGMRNMRGGSWVTPTGNLAATYRGAMKYSGWSGMIGFRCAKDAR